MQYKFTLHGVVQGVGFRPYVYTACKIKKLTGSVQNIGSGVVVLVNDRDAFIDILKQIPVNARIDSYEIEEVEGESSDFIIKDSIGEGYAEIPPDFFLCNDCLRELRDPLNRRYGYFFTTCTNCGPRFTIAKKAPYDRATTTMREFPLCSACTKEYKNPSDRRYHAQTIACPDCGPRLTLRKHNTVLSSNDANAISQTVALIKNGEIVAIKGIGGFHLVSNTAPETVQKLRMLRGRLDKPFAIMCRDIEMAKTIAYVSKTHESALLAPERAIVLVPKKKNLAWVSELDTVGIMLPYSALHYIMFEHLTEPIVMTSSNRSDEPMTTKDGEQVVRFVLSHSRTIANPADDSVIKIIAGSPFFIRRSRGYVPQSIPISKSGHTILALGAEMNNTFCIAKSNGRAILSQHMGNTANSETFERYKEHIRTFLHFTDAIPDLIVADLHPSYNTARYAELLKEEFGVPLIRVQHHKAHAYSAACENGLSDFVAIVSDGLGYGEEGTMWGGEIFHNDERVGHLEQHLQLGGDSVAQYPAKMLFSILRKFLSLEDTMPHLRASFTSADLAILDKQQTEKFNAPLTSSCGRVLDAVSFLLGFCNERTYDGRPAMLLESNSFGPLPLTPVIKDNVLMTTPLFEFLIQNLDKDKKRLAATAQKYLAEGLYQIATHYKKPIVWSGGCAYNTIMTSFMLEHGVLTNKQVPPGDGGISFGQVAYALKSN